jgi:hypothetical protein
MTLTSLHNSSFLREDLSAKNLRFGRFRKSREHSHDTQREILRTRSQIDFRRLHS